MLCGEGQSHLGFHPEVPNCGSRRTTRVCLTLRPKAGRRILTFKNGCRKAAHFYVY